MEWSHNFESPVVEDPDLRDNNILSNLEHAYTLITSGSLRESDVHIVTDTIDTLKEALFREGSFCASDIAQVLSRILYSARDTTYSNLIIDPIKDFCESHLHEIGQLLSHSSMANTEGFYDLILVYMDVHGVKSEEVKHIFLNKIDTIIKQLLVSTTVHQMAGYLKVFTKEEMIEYGIDQRMDNLLKQSQPIEFASIISTFLLLPTDEYLHQYAKNILSQKISLFGLDPAVVMDAWNKAEGFLSYKYDAIKQMCLLEAQALGSVSVLYKEFGILDFHRYPLELLLDQYENRDNLNIPYGVILYPRSDGNGAFTHGQKVFGSMYMQLKHIYTIRVSECDTKKDVVRMLLALDQKYGSEHKIEFIIIGGHGTKDSISFGGTHESHRLRLFDLKHEKTSGTKSFFENNPSVILHSCETGQEGGVAEELSKVLQGKVIAPETKTIFEKINATVDEEGKPVFSVVFRDGHTRVYNKGTLES